MTTDALAMLFPNVAVTRGIAVRVAVSYLAEQSDPSANRWFWSYHVRIENGSEVAVQLLSRSRSIVDGRGTGHEVVGEGVVVGNASDRPGRELRLRLGLPSRYPVRRDARHLPHGRCGRSAFDVEIPRFDLLST